MRTTWQTIVGGSTLILSSLSVHADTVTFEFISGASSANDITPSGRFIVGESSFAGPYRLDTTTGFMEILTGDGYDAVAVSDDGSVILGDMIDAGTSAEVAAIWRESTNTWTSLGYLPNALNCPSRSSAYELSGDGLVATGLSWDGCNGRGFRWTQSTGMTELQALANGNNRASVISGNGNLIGGFAQGSQSRTPCIWGASGAGQLLDPPSGAVIGEIFGMSDSGATLLGTWNNKATRWDGPGLVRTQIAAGSIIPGWTGNPMDIAANGTIVGFDNIAGNRRAWIQPQGTGPLIDLKTYIESNGGSVPLNQVLEVAQGISADGRTIIGHGFNGAWRVTITPVNDCPADIVPSETVDIDDLLAVIGAWGPCPNPNACPADISPASGDDVVNIDDLLAVIGAWGNCPPPLGACCTGASCSQMTQAACASAGGTYLGNGLACSPVSCDNNDHCADAINVTASIGGAAILCDNSTATPPGPFGGETDPELPAGSPTCHFNGDPDAIHSSVWYSFVAPANGSVTIATCNNFNTLFFDSLIALFDGECEKLTEIGCSEDDCANPPEPPYYSRLEVTGLTPGVTYLFCVMNSGDGLHSAPGPFEMTITSP